MVMSTQPDLVRSGAPAGEAKWSDKCGTPGSHSALPSFKHQDRLIKDHNSLSPASRSWIMWVRSFTLRSSYAGNFRRGARHGLGEYVWPDGLALGSKSLWRVARLKVCRPVARQQASRKPIRVYDCL